MYDAYVAYHARTRPRVLAVVTPTRQASYAEFNADVNRYAVALQGLGVGPDRGVVAVDTAGAYRQAVLLMALARLGVAAGTARDAAADLKISDRPGEASATVLRLSGAWLAATEQAAVTEVASAPRDPDAIARVMLSSGTTRTPRRVPLSWRRMEASTLNVLSTYAAGRLGVWALRTGLDSGLGNSLSAAAWTVGAAAGLGFVSPDLPALLERHPTGILGLTPIQLREMLNALPPGYELKPQWRIVVTGAVLTPALAREARTRLTPDIIINYGTTETGRATVGPASRLETHPGASGWVVPGATVEIVDPDGVPVGPGEQGEIRIRTERTTTGYLGDDQANAAAFRDGFFYPGDLGHWLTDGSLVVEGRVDERINVGGVKVLPDVLEHALLEHPQVRDAAAFVVPDAAGADACWMAVVCEGDVDRESLMAQLQRSGQRLPPIRFAWSEAIPRSEMGKIDRGALRAQTAAALAKSGT